MRQKKTGHKSTLGTFVGMIAVALILIILYKNITDENKTEQQVNTEVTKVQVLLDKEIETNYPATPREVVKLYLRIMSCYYNEDLTEDELQGLATQARLLFDEELLQNNPWDEFYANLKSELQLYQEEGKVVVSYEVDKGSAVNYYTKDNSEYASIEAQIITRDSRIRYSTNEKFILRKDTDGNYKILGWQYVEDTDLDEH